MSLPNLSLLQLNPTYMKLFPTYTVKILSAIPNFFIMNQVNTFSPSLCLDVSIAMYAEYHLVLPQTLSAVSLRDTTQWGRNSFSFFNQYLLVCWLIYVFNISLSS